MSIHFEGKVAAVTGGAQGIGAAVVELLSELGARVAVLDRDEEHGNELAERLSKDGREVSFFACDVGELESVRTAMDAAVERYGALHVLVHSAGIQRYAAPASTRGIPLSTELQQFGHRLLRRRGHRCQPRFPRDTHRSARPNHQATQGHDGCRELDCRQQGSAR